MIGRILRSAVSSLVASKKEDGDELEGANQSSSEKKPVLRRSNDPRSGHGHSYPDTTIRPMPEVAEADFLSAGRRIFWVTGGTILNVGGAYTSNLASARYRVLLPAAALEKLGWHSEFVLVGASAAKGAWGASSPKPGDTVIVSKVGHDYALVLANEAKARGARLAVDICDNYLEISTSPEYSYLPAAEREKAAVRARVQRALLDIADSVVAASEQMADVLRKHCQRNIDAVISDPVEMRRGEIRFSPGECLHLLWYGHGINFHSLKSLFPALAEYAKKQALNLTVVSNLINGAADLNRVVPTGLNVTYSPWSIEATERAIAECDIVIIPVVASQFTAAKSPNRLLEALWGGRFVVAGPLPVYQRFSDYAWVGENLIEGLEWALSNPQSVRERIGLGQREIETQFSADAIAKAWARVLTPANEPASGPAALTASTAHPPAPVLRLNLGCGDKILPGYVNVDTVESRAGKKPDILCDLRNLEPFADDSVDEILAVHVVEHFWRWEILDVLREWRRVLKPGAKIILECPNLIAACEEFLKFPEAAVSGGPEGKRSMWVFYGDPRWKDPYMVHRWGYTPQSLSALVEEAGFHNARQEPAQFKMREPRDMRIVAEKPVPK